MVYLGEYSCALNKECESACVASSVLQKSITLATLPSRVQCFFPERRQQQFSWYRGVAECGNSRFPRTLACVLSLVLRVPLLPLKGLNLAQHFLEQRIQSSLERHSWYSQSCVLILSFLHHFNAGHVSLLLCWERGTWLSRLPVVAAEFLSPSSASTALSSSRLIP